MAPGLVETAEPLRADTAAFLKSRIRNSADDPRRGLG